PVHQSEEAPIQLILVTDEGHHHANREFSSNHIPSGQPYDQYPFQAIDQAARYPNVDVELLNADALAGDFREDVLPDGISVDLLAKQFDPLDAADVLHKGSILAGRYSHELFVLASQRGIQSKLGQGIDDQQCHYHEAQLGAVNQDEDEGDEHHQAIHEHFDDA